MTEPAFLPLFLAILSAVASASPGQLGTGEGNEPACEPHARIVIEGDEDFESGPLPILMEPNAQKGVRGGSGTPEDPYRIENWCIKEDGGGHPALWIRGTTKHVLVRNMVFEAHTSDENKTEAAVIVSNAENIRFENIDAGGMRRAFLIAEAANVTIRSAQAWGNAHIQVARSVNVEISGLHAEGTGTGISWLSSRGRISDAVLINTSPSGISGGAWYPGGRVALIIGKGSESYPTPNAPSEVEVRGLRVVNFTAFGPNQRFPPTSLAVVVGGGSAVKIQDVEFRNNHIGISLLDASVEIHDSVFLENDVGIKVSGPCSPCIVRGSEFARNRQYHIENAGDGTVDAAENWWGSPDGPDADHLKGSVAVRPWLEQGENDAPRTAPGAPWLVVLLVAIGARSWRRRQG